MDREELHKINVAQIQKEFQSLLRDHQHIPISLKYGKGHSNTTRSKSYKSSCRKLWCGKLNSILQIHTQKKVAIVEPRVTMEELVKATLSLGLIPPIVPEFKGITVGGAIMGEAAESGSHRFGTFHDTCNAFELLCGNGKVVRASPSENRDLFYGIAGSYGSFGALLSAEIQLIPAKNEVDLEYLMFSRPEDAINTFRELSHASSPPDFLDGIAFAKDRIVVIKGVFSKDGSRSNHYSMNSPGCQWYYQHVRNTTSLKESMSLFDYLFRYDRGAFWMGAYLFKLPLLAKLFGEGVFKLKKPKIGWFTEAEIDQFHSPHPPIFFSRLLSYPLMKSQPLWSVLHRAEKWVQDRFCIQDFCILEKNALFFLNEVLDNPAIYPLWLCPIKGTSHPQLFSPHLLSKNVNETHFINIGIYGIPAFSKPMHEITGDLERKTTFYGGRKVLYSRSYYSKEEFWKIYSFPSYDALREKTHAKGIWHDITEKVLSE